MNSWWRIVAALMLSALFPTSIAAGIPLAYCFNLGEHHRIEVAQAFPHHHKISRRAGQPTTSVLAAPCFSSRGCLDCHMHVAQVAMQRPYDGGSASSKPQICGVDLAHWTEAQAIAADSRLQEWGYDPSRVLIAQRRKTVLQI